MMQAGYSGTKGNTPRYLCGRNKQMYGGERALSEPRRPATRADRARRAVRDARAGQLAATAKALAEADANNRQRLAVFELAVERARFGADRARRQFDAVEPENRLVARTLERSLEQAAVRQAEADLTPSGPSAHGLTEEEVDWLISWCRCPCCVPRADHDHARAQAASASPHHRGCRHGATEERRAELRPLGGRGHANWHRSNKTGRHFRTTDEDTVDLLRRLAERYDDKTVAAVLPSRVVARARASRSPKPG